MQFTSTAFALVGVLAASASAQYGGNSTIPAGPTAVSAGPTGTGGVGLPGSGGNGSMTTAGSPGATGYTVPEQLGNGAVGRYAGSGLGLLIAGGVAFAL